MVRLPNNYIQSVRKAGIQVYFAGRSTTKVWNSNRGEKEPLQYGGWYWMRTYKGRVIEMDQEGPFRSESAAIRDAFLKLQLRD